MFEALDPDMTFACYGPPVVYWSYSVAVSDMEEEEFDSYMVPLEEFRGAGYRLLETDNWGYFTC